MEVVASLSQGRTAAAQCGLVTHKSVPVIFEPLCTTAKHKSTHCTQIGMHMFSKIAKDVKSIDAATLTFQMRLTFHNII